jgi:hypothetical protein
MVNHEVQWELLKLGCGGSQIRALDPQLGMPAALGDTRSELDQIVVARAERRDRLAILPDHGDAHRLETGVGQLVKPAIADIGPQNRDGTKPVGITTQCIIGDGVVVSRAHRMDDDPACDAKLVPNGKCIFNGERLRR